MILPDWQIRQWAYKGGVRPFMMGNVNPASIDLRIGNEFVNLYYDDRYTMSGKFNLLPSRPILATTVETIRMPNDMVGILYLKSSLARQGLDHALAGFVDPGFCGQLTLELHAHRPVTLYAGQRVIQLVLHRMIDSAEHPYDGRYQNQSGPTMAREEKRYDESR